MVVLATLSLGFLAHLVIMSRLEHSASQSRAFAAFRNALANGVAPTGPLDGEGRLLAAGTPVALIDIPAIGVDEVVLEGTTSRVTSRGPGHLRSTVLPGQAGTSVIFGRAAAYGGPFGQIGALRRGDKITVTTGIGTSTFLVIDVRKAGDPVPPALGAGAGRLTLVTATGPAFVPTGVLRVDADLETATQPPSSSPPARVPTSEQPMGTDTGGLWEVVLLLQALVGIALLGVWSWRAWGRTQTWIVFVPLIFVVALVLADQLTHLLPNLQ
jgi:sortase A